MMMIGHHLRGMHNFIIDFISQILYNVFLKLRKENKMLEFLHRLFIGHNHKWVEYHRVNARSSSGGDIEYIIVVLQCEICGELKNHRII